jgi:hypothetical protein
MGAAQSAKKLVTLKSGRTRVFRSKQERREIVEETLKPGSISWSCRGRSKILSACCLLNNPQPLAAGPGARGAAPAAAATPRPPHSGSEAGDDACCCTRLQFLLQDNAVRRQLQGTVETVAEVDLRGFYGSSSMVCESEQ